MIAISDNVQVRKDKPSATVVINRPNCRNALSREMVTSLHQVLEDLHQEIGVSGVILTGSGPAFCAGTDLRELKETSESKDSLQIHQSDVAAFQDLIEYMLRYPKPIVCGINGWVVGSGVSLMLASDIVVADESAQLLLPESKLGLFSGITAALLAFRAGAGRASSILHSNEPMDAELAKSHGLFHETVANELVWARCHEVVSQIGIGAHQTHLLTKQMLNQTIGEELFTQLSIGSANTAAARSTETAIEGINAFLEKREPSW